MGMTAESYLNNVICKYQVNTEQAKVEAETIAQSISDWAGEYLVDMGYSGSMAKGTDISLASDADIFVSLKSTTPGTLRDIYSSLFQRLAATWRDTRKQNVSIRATSRGLKIDVVPGKRQSQYGADHSLYCNKTGSWIKTNIMTHISLVSHSARTREIKLAKIWRELNGLDFPSFYLELAVIDCLKGASHTSLSNNFWDVLGFLSDGFVAARYVDPANSNNVVSDDLTNQGKAVIRRYAQIAHNKKNWENIVW